MVEQEVPLEGKKTLKAVIIEILIVTMVFVVLGSALFISSGFLYDKDVLILATTTSTANSGLLDEILPDFQNKYDCVVKVIPVGTGQALRIGRNGDTDVVLVHAPESEIEFVKQGHGTKRTLVMHNQFLIVGPLDDPAGIKGSTNTTEALNNVFNKGLKFASRGDDSGTHKKERELWEQAGFDYKKEIDIPGNNWYQTVSAGMGDTLTRANELEAYTLTDQGTFYAYRSDLDLEIMLEGDPPLNNQYSVIPIDPHSHPHVNSDLAEKFVEWLVSEETQNNIADFEVNGKTLFTPNAQELSKNIPGGALNATHTR